MSDAAVLAASNAAIRQGSKSFAAAARLFDAETRADCVMLYAWCRHCDDVIDGQELGFATSSEQQSSSADRLEQLRRLTSDAAAGRPSADPVFQALSTVVSRKHIPLANLNQLLDGFAMDVDARLYDTADDVLDYAYHVAGVVGVMMARIMGVRDERILDRASDLGLAFQLTNIARDVIDDARAGRTYLPARWLAEEGIAAIDPGDPQQRPALHRVTTRLLDLSEPYYDSALVGMARLPWRSAWAIATARRVYRAIGSHVRRRGARAWDRRVSTGKGEKLLLLGLALWDVAASRLDRVERSRTGLYERPHS